MFQEVLNKLNKHETINIDLKTNSKLMKVISFILFFNKDFMKKYITTIGNTVYFPSEEFIEGREFSATAILFHEAMHIKDSNKFSKFIFSFLYLFPQILAPLFLLGFWYHPLFLFALCLAPIPAIFRAYFEFRAYCVSLYVMNLFNKTNSFSINLERQVDFFVQQFTGSGYYFMFPFKGFIRNRFDKALEKIKNNEKPYEDNFFNVIDSVLS